MVCYNFDQLTQIRNEYFSNVQCLNFCMDHVCQDPQRRARFQINIFKNVNYLKMLTVSYQCKDKRCEYSSVNELILYLNLNEIKRYYQIKSIFSCRTKSID